MDNQNEMSTKAYWDRKAANLKTDIEADREYLRSLPGRLEMAERRLNVVTSDSYVYTDAERAEALAAIEAIHAEMQTQEDAEWDRETTIARRAAWNAAVQDRKYRAGKTVLVGKIQQVLGFGPEVLRRQVARHRL